MPRQILQKNPDYSVKLCPSIYKGVSQGPNVDLEFWIFRDFFYETAFLSWK